MDWKKTSNCTFVLLSKYDWYWFAMFQKSASDKRKPIRAVVFRNIYHDDLDWERVSGHAYIKELGIKKEKWNVLPFEEKVQIYMNDFLNAPIDDFFRRESKVRFCPDCVYVTNGRAKHPDSGEGIEFYGYKSSNIDEIVKDIYSLSGSMLPIEQKACIK